jgi:hypothetical protein
MACAIAASLAPAAINSLLKKKFGNRSGNLTILAGLWLLPVQQSSRRRLLRSQQCCV